MFRTLAIAAIACQVSFAQVGPTPALPSTVSELKKNPAGLKEASDESLRGDYGEFPVTSVFIRTSDLVDTAYLVNGGTVFGYLFTFHKPGHQGSPLWEDGIADFLRATFPEETFKRHERSSYSINNIYHRSELVMNLKAQEVATRAFKESHTARLQGLVTGGTANGEKALNAPQARTIADYLKSFPDTTKAEPAQGKVAGFEPLNLSEFPADAFYRRKAGDTELIIAARQGIIIGYVASLPIPQEGGDLWYASVEAGLVAAFPDPMFKREPISGTTQFFYRILDRGAYQTAREAHVAEQAAKLKAALNP